MYEINWLFELEQQINFIFHSNFSVMGKLFDVIPSMVMQMHSWHVGEKHDR